MAYVTAIFDRTATDIATQTSKAFFNVSDWTRIYGNALFVRNEVQTLFGVHIDFFVLNAPTTTSFPNVIDFNELLASIEQLRLAALEVMPNLSSVAGFTVVTSSWIGGINERAPNYIDVNHWEQVIDMIHSKATEYSALWFRFARTGIAVSNAGLTRNNLFRS
jgi:hypothetical protein